MHTRKDNIPASADLGRSPPVDQPPGFYDLLGVRVAKKLTTPLTVIGLFLPLWPRLVRSLWEISLVAATADSLAVVRLHICSSSESPARSTTAAARRSFSTSLRVMSGSDYLVIKTASSIPKYSISVMWDISWATVHSSRAGTWPIFGSVMPSIESITICRTGRSIC